MAKAKAPKVKRAPMAQLVLQVCPTCLRLLGDGTVRCCCDDCGHPVDEHRVGMTCRICEADCGLSCSPWYVRRPAPHADPTSQ
jgi:hypothetical protein